MESLISNIANMYTLKIYKTRMSNSDQFNFALANNSNVANMLYRCINFGCIYFNCFIFVRETEEMYKLLVFQCYGSFYFLDCSHITPQTIFLGMVWREEWFGQLHRSRERDTIVRESGYIISFHMFTWPEKGVKILLRGPSS